MVTFSCAILSAQSIKSSLFSEADKRMEEVNKVNAQLYSPDNFETAMELYREADEDYKAGANFDDIRTKLKSCVEYFNNALEISRQAEITLGVVIAARNDALDAKANEYSAELWNEAEVLFNDAASELEDGYVNDAKERGGEAETLYRKAELNAIETYLLGETRNLLLEAEEQDVESYAPLTLMKAKQLVDNTVNELNNNRYDTDAARNLIQQAKYESLHSLYLKNFINGLRDNDKTYEDVILMYEEPIHKIAARLDLKAEFDEGYNKPAHNIINSIENLQDSILSLQNSLSNQTQEVALLKEELELVKSKLSGVETERSALSEKMEALEKAKQQYSEVQKLFTRTEALVLKDANDIIIRLVELNFGVGTSVIKPENYTLLSKLEQAIQIYPGCMITAEGHTDSQGSDETNLKLSQERADAVKSYLLANMDIEWSRIRAIGYGESSPIANNETTEGREKNRRIDIIIHPAGL
jgi:outer membrane protein OmpA-like peptidoglycan-associated protein